MFKAIGKYLSVAVIALLVGFGGGYYFSTLLAKSSKVESLQQDKKNTAENIQKAQDTSKQLDDEKRVVDADTASTREAVSKQVKAQVQKTTKEGVKNEVCSSPSPFMLNVGTVRLLNNHRRGVVGAASISDELFATPSDIGVDKLVDADIVVVGMYRKLAKEHDTLVDWVNKEIVQKQIQAR
ncbi:hypothetical protein LJC19_04690 [Oxalobacter sp. OttesenSCG-928-P03]|nr:hypothetical protein [Oxalobacter sp. OttesenSCG-928-P03]